MKKKRSTEKNKLSNGSGKNKKKKRKKVNQPHDRTRIGNSRINEVEEYSNKKSSSSLAACIFGEDTENAKTEISLSSSIFGSNAFDGTSNEKDDGDDKQENGYSGSNPKLGSLENLFSTSHQLEQIDDRVKKNLDRMVTNDVHSTGEQCKDSTTTSASSTTNNSFSKSSTMKKTRQEIIKFRKERCTSKDAIELTESITVQVPNLFQVSSSASLDGEDGSELAEIRRGMENMFTIQCDSIMRESGVLIIQSSGAKSAVKKNVHMSSKTEEGIIPTAIMESMSDKACAIEKKVCSRLDEKGIIIHAKKARKCRYKEKEYGKYGEGR